jgi:nucleoside permease NupC
MSTYILCGFALCFHGIQIGGSGTGAQQRVVLSKSDTGKIAETLASLMSAAIIEFAG